MNCGTLFLLLAVGLASSAPAEDQGRAWALTNTVGTDDITEGGLLTKHWTFFARMLNECGARGLEACLGSKALAFADGYLAQDSIPVAEGVALVRRNGTEARASEDEGEDSGSSVVQQLMGRFARFLRTFAVQLKFPETDQEEVAIGLDEGRKLKKFLLPMLLGIGVKVLGVIPLVFGALALLVGKAAFVSKLAFAIAALTGLSTIMGGLRGGSSSGGGDTRLRIPLLQQVLAAQPAISSTYAQPAVVSSYAQPALTSSYSSQPQATQYSAGSASGVSWPASSGSSSGGWSKRSLPLDGQQMAYAEQIPHDYYE